MQVLLCWEEKNKSVWVYTKSINKVEKDVQNKEKSVPFISVKIQMKLLMKQWLACHCSQTNKTFRILLVI